jgi:hypothetical protein
MGNRIGVGVGEAAGTAVAIRDAVQQAMAALGGAPPRGAYITATVEHDAAQVFQAFREQLGGVPLHGVTTSLGVLTPEGVKNQGQGAVAVMLFGGDEGLVRGASSVERDGFRAGAEAAARLLAQGSAPSLILFNASPGEEEAMLEGIASVLPGVPCQGGSAADHTIEGKWSVFTEQGPVVAGLSLLGVGAGFRVGTALRTPYLPTGEVARAEATGRRLERLGGEPAAQVLNRWLKGSIEHQARHGGNILAQTALQPIGIRRGEQHLITVHPAQIHADSGAVDVFARIQTGDELCSLGATPEMLVEEVARVIDSALAHGGFSAAEVKGAALIFCAGCAGALGPRIDEGLAAFRERLPGVPVLGLCTFGEQGFVPGVGNLHQDLSLSLTLLA